ncbi:dynein axonemal assembly factor 3 homolog [Prorops nasuta]|uniref:dynein axonemal assembly factor 3 homolog n=1 Tax=Prorops nasuta TaxID=863751 RepID=UPI0034CF1CF7
MWWGYSPPIDLQTEINGDLDETRPLEILVIGAADARHVIKTLASSYKHPTRTINYHVFETTLEQVARSILLISTCLDEELGLQEATRYYLEILGNTILRPATGKYLAKRSKQLSDIPTKTVECPWLNLDHLKHRDRDNLESIFKFWERATCEDIKITNYWDKRIRSLLKTRYDCREGIFDWDYHMVLKSRVNSLNLTIQEYRFWRNNGIAFTWLEGEPARSNPTLLSNIIQHGSGFLHCGYLGDITNGPFFTWALDETENKKKYRSTDTAEQGVMRAIHEAKLKEPLCDEFFAAHRDTSVINGIIVTDMPDAEIECEKWSMSDNKTLRQRKENISWTCISNTKVLFYLNESLRSFATKQANFERFDVIWIACNMTKQMEHYVSSLLKKGSLILIESCRFLSELRKEDLQAYDEELKDRMRKFGFREIGIFNSEKHNFARFCKA